MKHPVSVEPLTDSVYQSSVNTPNAFGRYPATLAGFLARHPGATHGVFDADHRLVYIGKEADLRAAHRKG